MISPDESVKPQPGKIYKYWSGKKAEEKLFFGLLINWKIETKNLLC